jgi:RecA/RadA recombinase
MGHPIMMMRFITKCKEALKKSPNTALLFLNQVRDSQQKVYNRFDPETHYPGGRYLRHILLAALRLKHGGFISSADETKVGRRVLIRGEKGKIVGPNGLEAGIDLYNIDCPELGFISGDFDWAKDLREVGERLGIIKTSGAWKSFGGKQIQGNSNFEREVRNSEEFSFALRKEIYNTFGIEISSGRFINARY